MYKFVKIVFVTVQFILLTNCGSISESDKVGNDFYEIIKSKKYEKIEPLLHPEALTATPIEFWIQGLQENNKNMGDLLVYKRTGFSTNTTNGITTATLKYDVTYVNGTLFEKIDFINYNNNQYKISHYQFNEDKNKLNQ